MMNGIRRRGVLFFHGNCIRETSPPTDPRRAGVQEGHAAPSSAPSRTRSLPKHLPYRCKWSEHQKDVPLGGIFPPTQQKQEDPSLRCPVLLPQWALQCRGGWGGLPAAKARCSQLDVCLCRGISAAGKHQPESGSSPCSHKQPTKINAHEDDIHTYKLSLPWSCN